LDSEAGWLAVWNGKTQHTFVERFRYVSGADYPDHCTLEFYLNGPGRQTPVDAAGPTPAELRVTPYYLETEIISPYISLRPGEEGSFETEWFATRSSEHIRGVTDAGVVSEPFDALVIGSSVQLRGEFGVFFPGRAEISFKSRAGEEVQVLPLGQVSSEEPFRLDRRVDLPKDTWRISLILRDVDGRNRGELGNIVLEEK
jgi:hypothetical protein